MARRTGSVRLCAAAGAAWIAGGGAYAADDASRWDGDARTAARLIAGSPAATGTALRAGIEIRLKQGWHTYWRYPGDAGVPPTLDFKASQNLKSVDVRFPAPLRMLEDGASIIGYRGDVVLPLRIVPQDPGKPVALRLKIGYAVCEKLCVPAEAKPELILSRAGSSLDSDLTAAEARVPKKAALGAAGALAIRAVRQEGVAPHARVVVDVAAPAGAVVDLFAEGPGADWALPVPEPVGGAPAGLQRFAFELDGAPPGVSYKGAMITLTAVAGGEAIEVSTRLD
jgi:DsbC/DsbD-like thiol-disulfide interchange protein